jgi:hypothetical protein
MALNHSIEIPCRQYFCRESSAVQASSRSRCNRPPVLGRHQLAHLYWWSRRGTSSPTLEHRFAAAFALSPFEHKRPNTHQPIPNNLPARVVFTEKISVFLGGIEGSREFLQPPPHRWRRGHLLSGPRGYEGFRFDHTIGSDSMTPPNF